VFDVPDGLLRIFNRDLDAAGIAKKDALGRVVHIHALRHSFGTHLSKAGVAPRVAQAAIRHSKIELTMNTYTDAKLLDTSAAVESLPDLPSLMEGTWAPKWAPTGVKKDHFESISDNLAESGDGVVETKKPRNPLGITGFSLIGPAGFEPTTSTTPR
jgi:hypothetical protein